MLATSPTRNLPSPVDIKDPIFDERVSRAKEPNSDETELELRRSKKKSRKARVDGHLAHAAHVARHLRIEKSRIVKGGGGVRITTTVSTK